MDKPFHRLGIIERPAAAAAFHLDREVLSNPRELPDFLGQRAVQIETMVVRPPLSRRSADRSTMPKGPFKSSTTWIDRNWINVTETTSLLP
jgi:hypothetical protein